MPLKVIYTTLLDSPEQTCSCTHPACKPPKFCPSKYVLGMEPRYLVKNHRDWKWWFSGAAGSGEGRAIVNGHRVGLGRKGLEMDMAIGASKTV